MLLSRFILILSAFIIIYNIASIKFRFFCFFFLFCSLLWLFLFLILSIIFLLFWFVFLFFFLFYFIFLFYNRTSNTPDFGPESREGLQELCGLSCGQRTQFFGYFRGLLRTYNQINIIEDKICNYHLIFHSPVVSFYCIQSLIRHSAVHLLNFMNGWVLI